MDVFGQIAVCDQACELICMFHVFRDKAAAWLPDGTRVGPVTIIGGPPTPDGPERIGQALGQVQSRVREPGSLAIWGERV